MVGVYVGIVFLEGVLVICIKSYDKVYIIWFYNFIIGND